VYRFNVHFIQKNSKTLPNLDEKRRKRLNEKLYNRTSCEHRSLDENGPCVQSSM
ncbi:unnamed protein product, partial [Schistosoma margrebowiei]|uniref:Uncharacterized protein n=1 Tax=Schistosoma margrebowiei TaxID=48269 RepID=A0AA85A241_9TREM